MARDYACYSDGWDDENHMADDYFDSRPDYREKNRRWFFVEKSEYPGQMGLKKTLMGRYGKTVRKPAATKVIKSQKETTHYKR